MLDEVGITLNEKRFQPASRPILTVLPGICVDTSVSAGVGVGVGVVKMPPPPPPPPPLGGA